MAQAANVPATWVKGVTIQPRWAEDFGSSSTFGALDQARQMNANMATFIIPLQQDNIYSTNIYKAPYAPYDWALANGTQKAKSLGMQVTYKIHLDPQDSRWRADINPADRDSWYRNYGGFLNMYADLARQNGADAMIIGGELISMATYTSNSDNTQRWQNMITQIRQRFSGKLTYSANWGGSFFTEEFPHIGFWSQLDYIGISAYFGLVNYDNPSVSALMDGWRYWNDSKIAPFQASTGKPVIFTEIGYRSISGTAINPWDYNHQGYYSTDEQVNANEALLQFWGAQPWFSGIHYWAWKTDVNCCAGETNYEVQGKPAYNTFKTGWASTGTTTPPPTTAPTTAPATTATPVPPTATPVPPNPGTLSFNLVSASVTPASAVPGTSFALNTSIKASAASSVLIDMEVYSSTGAKVFQQTSASQSFTAGQTRSFTFNWVSPTNQPLGEYTLSIGVFSNNWATNYLWSGNASSFALTSGSPVPTPAPTATPTTAPIGTPVPSTYNVEIWWPSNGVSLQGIQTFKAKVSDLDLAAYTMYWQVDGRTLNLMVDNTSEGPHKRGIAATSDWTWNANGPYIVNFVAKDSTGKIIAQKSVSVNVIR